ncbi:MAG: 2-oxoglutarate dehydrogenase E1 component [Bacteroidota bacterium]
MDKLSYLSNAEIPQLEALYNQYCQDPDSVDVGWRKFFEGFEFARLDSSIRTKTSGMVPDEFKVINLINGYRQRGHLFTQTNPVRTRRKYTPTLDLQNFGLSENDLNRRFEAAAEIGLKDATLQDILNHLQETYCHSIGVEFMYIRNTEIHEWLRSMMETTRNRPAFSETEKSQILKKLSEAVLYEKFIHKKFPGQKRFSLEGSESLIPAIEAIIEEGSRLGEEEFVIGMPHRGRLNVLANILHKSCSEIFTEFAGKEFDDQWLMGDVKYHLGHTYERKLSAGKNVKLSLAPNPSHLETVGPVVEGIVRARIDHTYKGNVGKITPIIIHGDASVSGQGVVYELLQMSELPAYKTGGSIHLVVNNQIGFTTNYLDSRSSIYCTDVAKIIQCPILHVNADDVEAVVYAVRMAMAFRAKFQKDVFIDLLGYRKYGHNEGDEPRFTQPTLYKIIEKHPDPREIYLKKLTDEGSPIAGKAKEIESVYLEMLESELSVSQHTEKAHLTNFLENDWKGIRKAHAEDFAHSPFTGVDKETLIDIGRKITSLPSDKKFLRKIESLQASRREMIEKGEGLDWAMGELLAFGSLVNEGIPVRMTGQDVQRGTFSHRHAIFTVEDTEEYYIPLQHLHKNQADFKIYNSLLSEYAVLGFEYGYSMNDPNGLTIWEAQFGDFANGAQIIFDQYISSAEDKWKAMSGLTVLLPHGFEGQGPEHSSARMERFLTLCADGNMQVANCTTPANLFHILRRQLKRDIRKPLIIFTPKSLLRHPACVSSLDDFSNGGFQEVIDDKKVDPANVERVVFCSGKIYYELVEERLKNGKWDTALVRVEQLYPFPKGQIKSVISRYPNANKHLWVQEEPANMGAWSFILRAFKEVPLMLIARPESGSPAVGASALHVQRQRKIVEKAFGDCQCGRVQDVCKLLCAPKEWAHIGETDEQES